MHSTKTVCWVYCWALRGLWEESQSRDDVFQWRSSVSFVCLTVLVTHFDNRGPNKCQKMAARASSLICNLGREGLSQLHTASPGATWQGTKGGIYSLCRWSAFGNTHWLEAQTGRRAFHCLLSALAERQFPPTQLLAMLQLVANNELER